MAGHKAGAHPGQDSIPPQGQLHTHTLRLGHHRHAIHLTRTFGTRRNRNARRKRTQTRGEHANATPTAVPPGTDLFSSMVAQGNTERHDVTRGAAVLFSTRIVIQIASMGVKILKIVNITVSYIYELCKSWSQYRLSCH